MAEGHAKGDLEEKKLRVLNPHFEWTPRAMLPGHARRCKLGRPFDGRNDMRLFWALRLDISKDLYFFVPESKKSTILELSDIKTDTIRDDLDARGAPQSSNSEVRREKREAG
jgi:hypothetical protein